MKKCLLALLLLPLFAACGMNGDQPNDDASARASRIQTERQTLKEKHAVTETARAAVAKDEADEKAQENVVRGLLMADCQKNNERQRAIGADPFNCTAVVDSAFHTAG